MSETDRDAPNTPNTPNKRPDKLPDIYPDELPENADWLRKFRWTLPYDKAEFLAFLRQQMTTIEEFKRFPIYAWHKDDRDLPWLRDL